VTAKRQQPFVYPLHLYRGHLGSVLERWQRHADEHGALVRLHGEPDVRVEFDPARGETLADARLVICAHRSLWPPLECALRDLVAHCARTGGSKSSGERADVLPGRRHENGVRATDATRNQELGAR
jgi:hypothetical protein